MTLNCCIIDDEPLAVKLLESYVLKTPGLKLYASYRNAVSALEALSCSHADVHLIFCDIQMPELNGLQFAEMMKHRHSRIVFTTAFDKYAIDGWKVDALHYLLKPVTYTDFLTVVHKARIWFEHLVVSESNMQVSIYDNDTTVDCVTDCEVTGNNATCEGNDESNILKAIEGDSMFVKSEHKLMRVFFDDILYVEGLKDYVKIYIRGERRAILSLTSMHAIEGALPSKKFQRTHRSFIVNMNNINTVERGQIVFGDKYIPISDTYKDIVLDYIAARTLQGR